MIDDLAEVDRLLRTLEGCLPITASATPGLVSSLRQVLGTTSIPVRWRVTRVDYAGDEGGIMCRIVDDSDDEDRAVHVSLTHLAFDESTPCACEIAAYQRHRRERVHRSRPERPADRSILA